MSRKLKLASEIKPIPQAKKKQSKNYHSNLTFHVKNEEITKIIEVFDKICLRVTILL
jgi:hypothetical protein